MMMSHILSVTWLIFVINFSNAQDKSAFNFTDIFNSNFSPKSFNPIWITVDNSGDFLYRNETTGDILRYVVMNNYKEIFMKNATLLSSNFKISPDLEYVLFAMNVVMRYRRSYKAQYTIVEVHSNYTTNVSSFQILEYCNWGPIGHALSFVDGLNNLFYQKSPQNQSFQITGDGSKDNLFNGIPDWLYEEEVIESRVSHYWSPDGTKIAYAKIDDTGVPLQDVPYYGEASDVYGKNTKIPYPKAGNVVGDKLGPNPKVTMYVYEVDNLDNKSIKLDISELPYTDLNELYFISVYWLNNASVMVTWANRTQNHSLSIIYDTSQINNDEIQGYMNMDYTTPSGWIEMSDTPRIFIEGGARYLMIYPTGDLLNKTRVCHVVNSTEHAKPLPIHSENMYETDRILAYDPKGIVYFITTFGNSSERHIAKCGVPGTNSSSIPIECLTCDNDKKCKYLTASFNKDASFYIEGCLGPDVPIYTLKSTMNENYESVIMEDNNATKTIKETKLLPTKEYFTVNTKESKYELHGQIWFPPGSKKGDKLKMLVYTYAGPGTQLVLETFPLGSTTQNWLTYLSSTHRIAVVSIDGRGSSGNGDKLKFEMYKNMGNVEIQDQIIGAKFAENKYKEWLDSDSKKAIFGWSYGGFTAAHAVSDSSNYFGCGISVAPVTDLAYYDTAYTER